MVQATATPSASYGLTGRQKIGIGHSDRQVSGTLVIARLGCVLPENQHSDGVSLDWGYPPRPSLHDMQRDGAIARPINIRLWTSLIDPKSSFNMLPFYSTPRRDRCSLSMV